MAISGSCHCGEIRFEIDGEIPPELTRCTCSFCAKRGALIAYFRPAQLRILTTKGAGATYRWNTTLVAHHFCERCGCTTFSDSPAFERDGSWDQVTRRLGVNARLFDGIDADSLPVTVIDGRHLW